MRIEEMDPVGVRRVALFVMATISIFIMILVVMIAVVPRTPTISNVKTTQPWFLLRVNDGSN